MLVLSTSLPDQNDDRVELTRSIAETVELLNGRGACGVYLDGGATIQSFLRERLVDELVLTRLPVLIGEGLPLFGSLRADVHLRHLGTVATSSGMVQSRYALA